MARKTKEDAEHTYAALLEAAEQMFFDKGVAHTTLNDIAAAAGMTRGAIYWHFKDKADVLQALIAQAMLPMEVMLVELDVCADTNPLAALRQMCVRALTTLAGSPRQQRVFSIMFFKCENIGEVVTVMENKLARRDECFTQIQGILVRAVNNGQLPADTDVLLSQQIINFFIAGTMREWLLSPHSFSLETAAPSMVDMVMAGLQTNPPRVPRS
jgi:TetR/AcrR family acrAB operon transcriptional repressor